MAETSPASSGTPSKDDQTAKKLMDELKSKGVDTKNLTEEKKDATNTAPEESKDHSPHSSDTAAKETTEEKSSENEPAKSEESKPEESKEKAPEAHEGEKKAEDKSGESDHAEAKPENEPPKESTDTQGADAAPAPVAGETESSIDVEELAKKLDRQFQELERGSDYFSFSLTLTQIALIGVALVLIGGLAFFFLI